MYCITPSTVLLWRMTFNAYRPVFWVRDSDMKNVRLPLPRLLDNSRIRQLADCQLADWTTRGCHRRLCVLSFSFWRHLRDRELSSYHCHAATCGKPLGYSDVVQDSQLMWPVLSTFLPCDNLIRDQIVRMYWDGLRNGCVGGNSLSSGAWWSSVWLVSCTKGIIDLRNRFQILSRNRFQIRRTNRLR